jgi:hypothetical protein
MSATHESTAWLQQHDNMVETQHGSTIKHGTNITGHRQQHNGQQGRDNNTSRNAATTVSKRESVIESLNKEIEIKLSSLLQLHPAASCSELKRGATQGCVCFGNL